MPSEPGIRPFTWADVPLFSRWLAAPHVATWWREAADDQAIVDRYGPALDGRDSTELFAVEVDGRAVGFAQRYRLADDPVWQAALAPAGVPPEAAGIDYLIGEPELVGQGIGPQLISQLVADTWARHPDVTAVVADVDQQNRRSWRALEKAGFTRQWSGNLDSADPSDAGPCHVYVCRPRATPR